VEPDRCALCGRSLLRCERAPAADSCAARDRAPTSFERKREPADARWPDVQSFRPKPLRTSSRCAVVESRRARPALLLAPNFDAAKMQTAGAWNQRLEESCNEASSSDRTLDPAPRASSDLRVPNSRASVRRGRRCGQERVWQKLGRANQFAFHAICLTDLTLTRAAPPRASIPEHASRCETTGPRKRPDQRTAPRRVQRRVRRRCRGLLS
jgi:hypothetical protein